MENEKMTYWDLIFSDVYRYVEYGGHPAVKKNWKGKLRVLLTALVAHNHAVAFTVWLRILQSAIYPPRLLNGRKACLPLRIIARIMHIRLRKKYGLQIPASTYIGPGLYLGHAFGIIINGKTKIGSRFSISHFVSIGSTKGTPAIIGDDVYLGPEVCLVEDVRIGNNVKVGAGTVVIHDIPDNSTSVGNPNRIIQH